MTRLDNSKNSPHQAWPWPVRPALGGLTGHGELAMRATEGCA